jgi:5'-nucleotidase
MRILLTNDDGIHSTGLRALWRATRSLGEVTIVAPTREQSGVSHSVSIRDQLHVFPWQVDGAEGYAVHGTPTDCVKIAILELMKNPPDLLISGINMGMNVGINALYSGTVAAALEGAMNGLPAIAVSTQGDRFDAAAEIAIRMVGVIRESGIPASTILNVNVPNPTNGEIRITRQSAWAIRERYARQEDNDPGSTFSIQGVPDPVTNGIDYDDAAVREGYVSITPMHFDLTHHPSISEWRHIFRGHNT